jgi:hypothetical protein
VLDGVLDQVLEHLNQPLRVHRHHRVVGGDGAGEPHLRASGQAEARAHCLSQGVPHTARHQLPVEGTAVLEQLLHQAGEALQLAPQDGRVAGELLLAPEARLEGVERRGDAEQGVANLVRDAPHQRAHGGQRLAAPQGFLQAHGRGDVADDQDHALLSGPGAAVEARAQLPGPPGARVAGLGGPARACGGRGLHDSGRCRPGVAGSQLLDGAADGSGVVAARELPGGVVEPPDHAGEVQDEHGGLDRIEGLLPLLGRLGDRGLQRGLLLFGPHALRDIAPGRDELSDLPRPVPQGRDQIVLVIQLPVPLAVDEDAAVGTARENAAPELLVESRLVQARLEQPRRLADRIRPTVAGPLLESRVDVLDDALAVRDDHAVRRLLHRPRQAPERLLGAPAIRDVLEGPEHAQGPPVGVALDLAARMDVPLAAVRQEDAVLQTEGLACRQGVPDRQAGQLAVLGMHEPQRRLVALAHLREAQQAQALLREAHAAGLQVPLPVAQPSDALRGEQAGLLLQQHLLGLLALQLCRDPHREDLDHGLDALGLRERRAIHGRQQAQGTPRGVQEAGRAVALHAEPRQQVVVGEARSRLAGVDAMGVLRAGTGRLLQRVLEVLLGSAIAPDRDGARQAFGRLAQLGHEDEIHAEASREVFHEGPEERRPGRRRHALRDLPQHLLHALALGDVGDRGHHSARPFLANAQERLRVDRDPGQAAAGPADRGDDVRTGAAAAQGGQGGLALVGKRPAARRAGTRTCHAAAQELGGGEAKDALGSGVAGADHAFRVAQDDALRQRGDDGAVMLLALGQGQLRTADRLEDGADGRDASQHEHRDGEGQQLRLEIGVGGAVARRQQPEKRQHAPASHQRDAGGDQHPGATPAGHPDQPQGQQGRGNLQGDREPQDRGDHRPRPPSVTSPPPRQAPPVSGLAAQGGCPERLGVTPGRLAVGNLICLNLLRRKMRTASRGP